MVSIEAQQPRTVALGVLLSFYLDFILVLPYFRFQSVLPKVQASSGTIGEAVRATQCHQYWRCIAATDNIIGAAQNTVLIGKAGERSAHLQAKRSEFVAPIRSFHGFFMFAALHLLAKYELQNKQYWRSIRKTKEQAKRGKLLATLCLLLQKSPNNFSVQYETTAK